MTMPRVLVVDDDQAVRDMVQEGLRRDGFEVVTAANVSDALRHWPRFSLRLMKSL
jgi:CheY-like chemotaxis protein